MKSYYVNYICQSSIKKKNLLALCAWYRVTLLLLHFCRFFSALHFLSELSKIEHENVYKCHITHVALFRMLRRLKKIRNQKLKTIQDWNGPKQQSVSPGQKSRRFSFSWIIQCIKNQLNSLFAKSFTLLGKEKKNWLVQKCCCVYWLISTH